MYKPLRWNIQIVLIFLVVVSCQPATPTPVSRSKFTDPDEGLTQAVRQAQDTLYIWHQAFLSPKASYVFTSLKVRFNTLNGTEDIWTEPVDVLGSEYLVRMVEGVTLETKAHPDRYVEIPRDNVIDWMILKDDGTVMGGYTLRLEYSRLPPEEQEKYEERTGFLRFE